MIQVGLKQKNNRKRRSKLFYEEYKDSLALKFRKSHISFCLLLLTFVLIGQKKDLISLRSDLNYDYEASTEIIEHNEIVGYLFIYSDYNMPKHKQIVIYDTLFNQEFADKFYDYVKYEDRLYEVKKIGVHISIITNYIHQSSYFIDVIKTIRFIDLQKEFMGNELTLNKSEQLEPIGEIIDSKRKLMILEQKHNKDIFKVFNNGFIVVSPTNRNLGFYNFNGNLLWLHTPSLLDSLTKNDEYRKISTSYFFNSTTSVINTYTYNLKQRMFENRFHFIDNFNGKVIRSIKLEKDRKDYFTIQYIFSNDTTYNFIGTVNDKGQSIGSNGIFYLKVNSLNLNQEKKILSIVDLIKIDSSKLMVELSGDKEYNVIGFKYFNNRNYLFLQNCDYGYLEPKNICKDFIVLSFDGKHAEVKVQSFELKKGAKLIMFENNHENEVLSYFYKPKAGKVIFNHMNNEIKVTKNKKYDCEIEKDYLLANDGIYNIVHKRKDVKLEKCYFM